MENRIKAHEKYMKYATAKKLSYSERAELATYHNEMLANFQHERLIHLIIMLFFVAVSLALICVLTLSIVEFGFAIELSAFYALVLIVIVLTIAYIRHYYFLENHIQALYKYTKFLMRPRLEF